MSFHEFVKGRVNELTCDVCKEPKASPDHRPAAAAAPKAAKQKQRHLGLTLPVDVYDDLVAHAKKKNSKPNTVARELLVLGLGWEFQPARPARVIPGRPASWRKKGLL